MSEEALAALVDQMTLDEQVLILSGADFWSVPGIDRLGHRQAACHGWAERRARRRLVDRRRHGRPPFRWASLLGPAGIPALVTEIGAALAEEVKSKGAHVLLGANGEHSPLCHQWPQFRMLFRRPRADGRPRRGLYPGLQGQGISATIKHFAGNESEIERTTINSKSTSGPCAKFTCARSRRRLRGRHLGDDVVLQPAERHLCRRKPLAADRGVAATTGAMTVSSCPTGSARAAPRRL